MILQFDVTEEGSVENPVVLEAKPPGIFDRSALRAAAKFKYKPKILNGQPVRVTGVKIESHTSWRNSSTLSGG